MHMHMHMHKYDSEWYQQAAKLREEILSRAIVYLVEQSDLEIGANIFRAANHHTEARAKDVISWQLETGPRGGDICVIHNPNQSDLQIGIIAGECDFARALARTHFEVTTNMSAFRDDSICQCSGGPSYYVERNRLIPTGYQQLVTFWRWNAQGPGANNGVEYDANANIWLLQLNQLKDPAP